MNGGKIKPDYRCNEGSWKKLGIQNSNRRNTIKSNHFDSKKYVQKYEGGGIQVGCNFIVYLKSIHTIERAVKKPK